MRCFQDWFLGSFKEKKTAIFFDVQKMAGKRVACFREPDGIAELKALVCLVWVLWEMENQNLKGCFKSIDSSVFSSQKWDMLD